MFKYFTSKIISGYKLEGWSMSRRSEDIAPDMTIQAKRFTKRGYFKPRPLDNNMNVISLYDVKYEWAPLHVLINLVDQK